MSYSYKIHKLTQIFRFKISLKSSILLSINISSVRFLKRPIPYKDLILLLLRSKYYNYSKTPICLIVYINPF